MANYEYFYPGTPYTLDPEYGELFTGYRVLPGEIGAPTSIQTANQIQEVANLLNQGIKTIELQPISPEVFETIPKQHFKEINRLTKLTGTEPTVHAPMIDPAGFTKEGWSESTKEVAERQLKEVVEKSHELNPEGNIPVTIHASGIPGAEYFPGPEGAETKKIIAINQETKQLMPVQREEKFYPEEGAVIRTPEDEIKTINNTEWINNITNLAFYKKEADEILVPAYSKAIELQTKGIATEQEKQEYEAAVDNLMKARLFLGNVESSFRSLYNKAYKYGDDDIKRKLNNISELWKKKTDAMKAEKDPINLVITESNLIDNTLKQLREVNPPEVYKPVEDFAKDKAADTLGAAAFHGFEKFGNKAPIVSIENLFPGMAFSRSEQLKELVEVAKEKFVNQAMEKGVGRGKAREMANKLIGVTWDVGHLNLMRKEGFKEEEIIKETEKIAKLVKHVHLTDNFGYNDVHLPPGMGNVPTKEILKQLEKAGFKGKKIIEAGGFVQHFKVSPQQYVLEALGSPLYGMMMPPYWNQMSATYGSYFGTPMAQFPEQHFSLYGGGFATLPQELGGQMPGKQSKVSGTPMA